MVKTPAHESGPSFLCEGWGAESVPRKKRGWPRELVVSTPWKARIDVRVKNLSKKTRP